MSQIRVDHLTFSYDGSVEPVFENATFSLVTVKSPTTPPKVSNEV